MSGETPDFDAEFEKITTELYSDTVMEKFNELMTVWRVAADRQIAIGQPLTPHDTVMLLKEASYTFERYKMVILLGAAIHRLLEIERGNG